MRIKFSNVICLIVFEFGLLRVSRGADGDSFSLEELQKLQQFRELIKDYDFRGRMTNYLNSSFPGSFLRGRYFDVEQAAKDLRENIQWRADNRVEDVLDPNLKGFDWREYPYYMDSTDVDGRPVIIVKAGEWDIRKSFILNRNMGNISYSISIYCLQIVETAYERLLNISAETGKDISRVVTIMDMHGYNLRTTGCARCLVTYVEMITYFEVYYRGFIKCLFVINVPRVFAPLVRLLWPLGSKHSKDVLQIFGPRREDWQKALLTAIPPDQLWIEYGGTKKRGAKGPFGDGNT